MRAVYFAATGITFTLRDTPLASKNYARVRYLELTFVNMCVTARYEKGVNETPESIDHLVSEICVANTLVRQIGFPSGPENPGAYQKTLPA